MTSGSTALERCVGEPESFLAEHFGRHALWRRQSADAFADLFGPADADHLVTSAGLRTPAMRLVRNGAGIPSSGWTRSARIGGVAMPGIVDPRAVLREFDGGATVVLQGLHRFWPPLRRFCRELEEALGHPCQVNAYLTPAGAQGLALHDDSHDVFVLQSFGTKGWEVHAADPEPWELVLEPGDMLYMPAGTPHAARAQAGVSGHLTIGVLSTSWRSYLDAAVRRALDDPVFAAPLPAGWHHDPDRFAAELRDHLDLLVDRMAKTDDVGTAIDQADGFLRTRHPVLIGGFASRLQLDRLSDETVVRVAPGAIAEIRRRETDLVLLIGDAELRMPGWVDPAVRLVVDGADHRVADLAVIDHQSRLVLVRRLVREGVLEIVA
ncbi:MAG: cupin domain-containing protein [Acidimicrobiales bacterium]